MNHAKKLVLVLAMAATVASGCYGASVVSRNRGDGVVRRSTGISWFWGLTETRTHAFGCNYGLSYVRTFWPWWAVFAQWFTGGIVNPVTKEWMCAAPPAAPVPAPAPAPGAAAPAPAPPAPAAPAPAAGESVAPPPTVGPTVVTQ